MEILRGAPALSEFRVHKLLQSCAQRGVEIADVYAEYVHFAELSSPLSVKGSLRQPDAHSLVALLMESALFK